MPLTLFCPHLVPHCPEGLSADPRRQGRIKVHGCVSSYGVSVCLDLAGQYRSFIEYPGCLKAVAFAASLKSEFAQEAFYRENRKSNAPTSFEMATLADDSTERPYEKKTALQLISQGTCLPGIPKHPTFATQRQWELEQMALAFRVFARKGYTSGMAGHISVRDPENPHTFWTVGISFEKGFIDSLRS